MRCKAVILAAGMGMRLSPLTPSVPKELLPVCGLPAIHHVVYEMAELGVEDVLIVLSEGKEAIRDYFTKPPVPKGDTATALTERLQSLVSRVHISFAYQRERRGTGDAVLLAKDFAADDDLIVAYPDDLILLDDGVGSAPKELLAGEGYPMLLVRAVPRYAACRYGVIFPSEEDVRNTFRVRAIVEKPTDYPYDSALVLVGRMRLTKECIEEIPRHPLTDSVGITYALNALASRGRLYATVCRSAVYDVGSHEGYLQTVRVVTAMSGI